MIPASSITANETVQAGIGKLNDIDVDACRELTNQKRPPVTSTLPCQQMALQTTLPGHSPVWTSSQNMLTVCGRVFANMTFCFCHRKRILFLLCTILSLITKSLGIGEVVWAVNCGGDAHTDINGIRYEADSLKVGISSDYGKTLMVSRVVAQDQILYQTERYHMSTFGYDIPLNGDGEYVLVLKFCEVWFTSPNQKVFDVTLNGEHTVVDELDIYSKVGRGVAHDELIEFTIRSGKLKVNGETSKINSKLLVEFMKGDYDNPKINAIYLMKGTIDDIPKLPSLPGTETSREEEEVDEEEETSDRPSKARRPSGPKVKDPYASDDTSTMLLPVIMALGAFIPLLFCLCKL